MEEAADMTDKKFGVKFAATMVAAGLVLAGVGFGAVRGYRYLEEQEALKACRTAIEEAVSSETYYDHLSVEGVSLAGMTKDEAREALASKEKALRDPVDVSLTLGDESYSYTEADFSYQSNLEEVLEEAFAVAREGTEEEKLAAYQALMETPIDYALEVTLDDSNVETIVASLAEHLNQEASEGKLTFHPLEDKPFTYEGGKDGLKVDEEATCEALRALLAKDEKTGSAEIVAKKTTPKTSLDALKKRTVLLSSFSTTATNTDNARYNMQKALGRINGTVLQKDESFSFNETVGNSSIASDGWKSAGTLSGGKVVDNYGGGVCQAATTLYGALMRANLYVSERSCHAWPSTYVPIGQDATISYGYLDLKFENNTGYPIYIEAWMDDPELHVNIYGFHPEEWDEIKVTSQTTAAYEPDATIYKNTDSLPAGTTQEDVTPRTGYSASGQKEFYKDGKLVDTSPIFSSYYAPVTGVVLVGTG